MAAFQGAIEGVCRIAYDASCRKMKVVKQIHCKKAIALIRKQYDISVWRDRTTYNAKSSCWWPSQQSITIGTKETPPFLFLAKMAHELGHCLSVRRTGKYGKGSCVDMKTYLLYIFRASLTKKQKTAVLAEERIAWRLGFKFLRDNGLPVNDMMLRARRLYLKYGHPTLHK